MKWKNSLKDGFPEDQQTKYLVREKLDDGYEYWICEKDRDFQILISPGYYDFCSFDDFDWIDLKEDDLEAEE